MQGTLHRRGIAMIELIFAIVVMGIALMSAPTLISTAKQSVNVALQQEGINEASSRIAMLMTYPWDENDTNTSCTPPVLQVNNGDSELNENLTVGKPTGRRVGVPLTSSSRTFLCKNKRYSASTIGPDNGDSDDVDDFNQPTNLAQIDNSMTGQGDYIETTTVSIATSVYYASDNVNYSSNSLQFDFNHSSVNPTTNIKGITVTLTSTSGVEELNKTIVLHGFTCNIGGYTYEKRTF